MCYVIVVANYCMNLKDYLITRWARIKRKFRLFVRRFASNSVMAVYDDDLEGLLEKLGLLSKIKSGEFKCSNCECTITLDNLGVIENENDVIKIYCLATFCSENSNGGSND